MSAHISADLLSVRDLAQPPTARRGWVSLNRALWLLQVLSGLFFAGSGFGKVLLYDAALYAAAPLVVFGPTWYTMTHAQF